MGCYCTTGPAWWLLLLQRMQWVISYVWSMFNYNLHPNPDIYDSESTFSDLVDFRVIKKFFLIDSDSTVLVGGTVNLVKGYFLARKVYSPFLRKSLNSQTNLSMRLKHNPRASQLNHLWMAAVTLAGLPSRPRKSTCAYNHLSTTATHRRSVNLSPPVPSKPKLWTVMPGDSPPRTVLGHRAPPPAVTLFSILQTLNASHYCFLENDNCLARPGQAGVIIILHGCLGLGPLGCLWPNKPIKLLLWLFPL